MPATPFKIFGKNRDGGLKLSKSGNNTAFRAFRCSLIGQRTRSRGVKYILEDAEPSRTGFKFSILFRTFRVALNDVLLSACWRWRQTSIKNTWSHSDVKERLINRGDSMGRWGLIPSDSPPFSLTNYVKARRYRNCT